MKSNAAEAGNGLLACITAVSLRKETDAVKQ